MKMKKIRQAVLGRFRVVNGGMKILPEDLVFLGKVNKNYNFKLEGNYKVKEASLYIE